jgi:enamine deaminase RidA (YjgF/YER057c/UK114 family)
VGGDFQAQAEQEFKNLQAAVGAGFADIVKLNSYLKRIADLPILREVRTRYLDLEALPASTTLGVPGFARPGALLEIEAVAVRPPAPCRRAGEPHNVHERSRRHDEKPGDEGEHRQQHHA